MAESKDYRQVLTDRLIEQLEQGTAPWQKPWDAKAGIPRLPYNPTSGKEYRGANSLALSMYGRSDPRWCTYKQAEAKGWQVRKGEKGALVEYWKFFDEQPAVDDKGRPILDEKGEQKKITVQLEKPQVFRAVVFNAEQMDNVPELAKGPRLYEWDPLERAEQILASSQAKIFHDQNDRAFYSPARDEIHMPGRDQFPSSQAYYSTALHELGHWTGHESRLGRDLTGGFGSSDYAKEELRAELASYFLADKLGIPHEAGGLDQHAAYVKSWIKALKDDKNEIFRAARDAEQITEYVLQMDRERTKEVGQERGEPARDIGAENGEVAAALARYQEAKRNIEQPQPLNLRDGKRQSGPLPGQLEADFQKERLDEATQKAFGFELPASWNGNVQVMGVVEVEENGRKEVVSALEAGEGVQPQFYGVYAQLEGGRHEWLADRPDLAKATDLAERLVSVHQLAQPKIEAVLAVDVSKALQNPDVSFEHFTAFKGGANLDEALRTAGLQTVGDVTGHDLRNFGQTAREKLSTVFGIAPGESEVSNAYLEHKGLSTHFALTAGSLVQGIEFEFERKARVTVIAPPPPEKELAKERTALNVPYREKEAAKALGAKWDKDAKGWYAPEGTDLKPLAKWLPKEREQGQSVPAPAAEGQALPSPAVAKAAHEMKLAEFMPTARAEKLVEHGREWQVYQGEKSLGMAEGPDAESAIKAVHHREVNNALWGNSPAAPWASDPGHTALGSKPTMPPPAVLAEYPDLVEKFPEVVKAAPVQEKTWLAVPFKEKHLAREAGAKWDTGAKAWYAPPGVDLEKLSKWIPRQDLGQAKALDPLEEFAKAIRAAGLEITDKQGKPLMYPEMDGELHRVPLAAGKKGNRDGAYVGYLDGRPAGIIHNWSTGERQNWKLEGPELSAEERARLAAEAAVNKQQRAEKLAVEHEAAAGKATARWNRAAELQPGAQTPYLERKQVEGFGLRREGNDLLVPVRDVDGKMWAVQTIFPEKKELVPGTEPLDKVFTKDAKKEGHFHMIGQVRPGEPIITVEGYATGASVHMATGYAVAVSFDSGNLEPVVAALKERYPTNPHFVGADDDRFAKPGRKHVNAGLTKAIEAASKHEVGVIVPKFAEGSRGTDFNDMHVEQGIGAVTAVVDQAIGQTMARSRDQANELARQRLGPSAEIEPAAANSRHTGEVVGVTGYHATQVKGEKAVVHQVKDLDKLPTPGKVATIQYHDGKAKVTDRSQDKDKNRQAQLQR